MIIPEQQLASHSFSERDAVFITDSVQVEFIKSKSNGSLSQSWLVPLSTEAYGAVLKHAHRNVRPYFEFVDFEECKRLYRELALGYSRTWLKELGLEFQIEGIDLAKLDASCQFLLFIQTIYIARTAERLIHATRQIDTFFVIEGEQRLPQDFYFDSDVPAAVLRFVCNRLGRAVQTIVMKERPRYNFPDARWRPIMDDQALSIIYKRLTPKLPRSSACRVGFAPATVANAQQVVDAIRNLRCPMVLFPSIWPTAQIFDSDGAEENEYVFILSAADGEWATAVASRLSDLGKEFFQRRARSTLPNCVINNPELDFQFDYIFTRRWLSYANMIHRAVRFVASRQVDLFIHSDHFTAEGAILAQLYRHTGTRVMVALHSGWPCDRNWASWDPSDSAMAPSKSAADKIRELSGMTDVFVTGALAGRTYRSLIRTPALVAERMFAAGQRKIVLFITNALELNYFPFTALKSHFETVSHIVRRIPEHLKDQILIVIRTKPGQLGEDPILYRELCSFSAESLSFLDGLDFSQSIQLADCVVGVNTPTSGYFEILRRGVPLIHLQTADAIVLQPDLPSDVVQRITELSAIWPAIEAILFDERQREKALEIQQRFVAADFTPTVSGGYDPVEALIRRQLRFRNWPNLNSIVSASWQRITGRFRPTCRSAPMVETSLPRSQNGGAGHVDDVLLGSDGTGVVIGWAADTVACRPAKAIHVFLNSVRVGEGPAGQRRSDVAAVYNDKRLEQSGFSVTLASFEEDQVARLSVYAELHDGTFFELQNPGRSRE